MAPTDAALQAILIVFGAIWCKDVLGRLRADVAELRGQSEWSERVPTIGIWLVTAGIGAWMIRAAFEISAAVLARV